MNPTVKLLVYGESGGAVAATVLTVPAIGAMMTAFGRIAREQGAALGARGARTAGGLGGAAADRARPARSARPWPLGCRAEERPRCRAHRVRPRSRRRRAAGHPDGHAAGARRGARGRAGIPSARSRRGSQRRTDGAHRRGHRVRAERRRPVPADGGRRRARVGRPRRHDQREPDVALLDIELPGLDGLAAAGELVRDAPATRSLILTTFGRPAYLRRALDQGASGFLLKDAPAKEPAAAIREVAAGRQVLDPALSSASRKLGARNRGEAVALANEKGWL